MKTISWFAILLAALVASGCGLFKHKHSDQPAMTATATVAVPKPIVTPDMSLAAKVVRVNPVARIAILNFPDGKMPRLQQTMFVYRAGLKVAEVKIVGPQDEEHNIVADIISGDPEAGFFVRAD